MSQCILSSWWLTKSSAESRCSRDRLHLHNLDIKLQIQRKKIVVANTKRSHLRLKKTFYDILILNFRSSPLQTAQPPWSSLQHWNFNEFKKDAQLQLILNDGSPSRSWWTMPIRSILMMNVHLQAIEGSLNYNADIDDQYTMAFVTSWAGHTKRPKTMMTQSRFWAVHLAMAM